MFPSNYLLWRAMEVYAKATPHNCMASPSTIDCGGSLCLVKQGRFVQFFIYDLNEVLNRLGITLYDISLGLFYQLNNSFPPIHISCMTN